MNAPRLPFFVLSLCASLLLLTAVSRGADARPIVRRDAPEAIRGIAGTA